MAMMGIKAAKLMNNNPLLIQRIMDLKDYQLEESKYSESYELKHSSILKDPKDWGKEAFLSMFKKKDNQFLIYQKDAIHSNLTKNSDKKQSIRSFKLIQTYMEKKKDVIKSANDILNLAQ